MEKFSIRARIKRARQQARCAWWGHRETYVGMERIGNDVATLRVCDRCPYDRVRAFTVEKATELPDNVIALERVG